MGFTGARFRLLWSSGSGPDILSLQSSILVDICFQRCFMLLRCSLVSWIESPRDSSVHHMLLWYQGMCGSRQVFSRLKPCNSEVQRVFGSLP